MSLIVVIQNMSKLAPISNYHYRVLVGDGTPERSTLLAEGEIHGHVRREGWQALLKRLWHEETV